MFTLITSQLIQKLGVDTEDDEGPSEVEKAVELSAIAPSLTLKLPELLELFKIRVIL